MVAPSRYCLFSEPKGNRSLDLAEAGWGEDGKPGPAWWHQHSPAGGGEVWAEGRQYFLTAAHRPGTGRANHNTHWQQTVRLSCF